MTVHIDTDVTTTVATINTVALAASVERIALSKLRVAEENVRRTDRKDGIERLNDHRELPPPIIKPRRKLDLRRVR